MSWSAVIIGGVALVGSLAASNQQQDQADQDKTIADSNTAQSIANMQAVEAQASAQELATRQAGDQYLGRQRAAMADSGTGALDTGSNYAVAHQSAVAAEMDALNVRYSGQLQGAQALQQAYNFQYGAAADQAQADSISQTKVGTAGLAALQAGAGQYGKGASLKQPGVGVNTYTGGL